MSSMMVYWKRSWPSQDSPELSRYHSPQTEIVTRARYFTERCTNTTSATPNKKPAPEQKPDNDDDCVCMDDWKPPPAQSHRQNALEGWMAANGVSAKGKDPAN